MNIRFCTFLACASLLSTIGGTDALSSNGENPILVQWGDFAEGNFTCKKELIKRSNNKYDVNDIDPFSFQVVHGRTTTEHADMIFGDVVIKLGNKILRGGSFSGASWEFLTSYDAKFDKTGKGNLLLVYDRDLDELVLTYNDKSFVCTFSDSD